MIHVEKHSKLIIITNDNKKVEENIVSIITEGEKGKIEILPNHANSIISTIPTITTFITCDGKEKNIFTSHGIIYIDNNLMKFCCGSINWPEEIDLEQARLSEKSNINMEKEKN